MSQRQQKIVWAEGLFLGQQHFQQWDRVFQRELQQRSQLTTPHCWGLVSLNLLEEALEMGQCRLESITAILPNGQWVVHDSQRDGGPLLCDLTAGGDRVDVWLALPDNDRVAGINGYREQGRLCAWRADYQEVADEHDPVPVKSSSASRTCPFCGVTKAESIILLFGWPVLSSRVMAATPGWTAIFPQW